MAATFSLIGTGVYVLGVPVVTRGFSHIEEDEIREAIGRSRYALGYVAEDLAIKLADWASWDDVYAFIEDRNEAFMASNMNSGSLESLRVDAMVFLNARGDVVSAASGHSGSHNLSEISPDLAQLVADGDPLFRHDSETSVKSGLIRLGDEMAVVASRPILTSHSEGPMRGTLVFVRMVTPEFVATVGERLRTAFSLTLVPAGTPLDEREHITIEGSDRIATTTMLSDIHGRALCRLDQEFDRPVYREARMSLRYFLAALVVAAATAIVTCTWTMRRIVVARLARLHQQIGRIERSGDLSLRVSVNGRDELAEVASSLNEMVASAQRARASLAASEDRFRTMADGSPMLVWVVDRDRKATYLNRSWLEFTGRRLEQELGDGWADSVHPEDRERCVQSFFAAFAARGPYQDEYRMRRTDGVYRWLLDKGMPLHDSDGEFQGYIGSCVDITERRAMEERLRAAEAMASRASSAKSEFVSHLSHEIRTPMTAILGYADLMNDDGAGALSEERRQEAIQAIRRNGEHLLALVNDVLDMSKIEAGRMSVERIACAPRRIVDEVVSLLSGRAAAAGLELKVEVADTVPEGITSDPLRLRQILVNLAGNAIKFTRQGSVTMRMTYESGAANRLRVEVEDTGVGMTAEQMSRLFAEYSQGDESVSRKFGGTGLGLSISRNLAKLMGGDIAVRSEPGRGTTFAVTVEAPASAAPSTPGDTRIGERPLSGRILLAEDSIDSQRLIRFVLERAGARVHAVGDGREAVAAFEQARDAGEPFDLVLMDTQMPEMDGFEATRALRAAGAATPILALTAHALAEDRARCLAAGCDEHAGKPIDRVELIATCRRLMASMRGAAAPAS
jgi:PAS domain S-box-containing protein